MEGADPVLGERRHKEAALDAIFEGAASQRDVPAFLAGLVRELHTAYGASGAIAFLVDPTGADGAVRTVASAGLGARERCGAELEQETDWRRDLLKSGQALTIDDLQAEHPSELESLARKGVGALAAFPLSFEGEVLGLLVLLWDHPLLPGDAGGLRRFAARAGVTLGLVRLLAAVRDSEAKYRALMEGAMDAIFLLDAAGGEVLACNRRAEILTGTTRDVLLGRKAWDLQGPAGEGAVQGLFRQAVDEGEVSLRDVPLVRPDGRLIRMDLSASSIPFGGRSVVQVVARDSSELHELQQRLRDYAKELEVRVDEKTSELRRSQAQLVQSEKMAALGALVAGVAHEINTPVGSIVSNAQTEGRCVDLIREALADPAAAALHGARPQLAKTLRILAETTQVTRTACERIHGIVRNLKNFVRLDEGQLKSVDVHEGLDSTIALVHHELRDRVRVVRQYGDVPLVECHPNQINQVFMNLLVNAAQAISGPGEVRIRTYHQEPWVRIDFADTGVGIPPDMLERVFEPGFTTKPAGVGTGLGLSIVQQILQDHCGTVTLASEPGKGSVFTVSLPATKC